MNLRKDHYRTKISSDELACAPGEGSFLCVHTGACFIAGCLGGVLVVKLRAMLARRLRSMSPTLANQATDCRFLQLGLSYCLVTPGYGNVASPERVGASVIPGGYTGSLCRRWTNDHWFEWRRRPTPLKPLSIQKRPPGG